MRLAFLADIHANLEAFQACLADLRTRAVDRVVFLGDIVGYGADPGPCLDLMRDMCSRNGAVALRGNHDEAVANSDFRFNAAAGLAMGWTRSVLTRDQIDYVSTLPLSLKDDDREYVHASAHRPSAYSYVTDSTAAAASLKANTAALTVVGHVHAPALYHLSTTGKLMNFNPHDQTPIPLSSQRRWLAVMGAVGQPRDGNPAACYGIFDLAARELTYVRVPYDVERAAAKIRAAGLPESLWKRLSQGR
jgi:diadenosine tetraphosphatase ApaH/serine/threonine PP2A family protein phosphatase